jgi:hypothetical protein
MAPLPTHVVWATFLGSHLILLPAVAPSNPFLEVGLQVILFQYLPILSLSLLPHSLEPLQTRAAASSLFFLPLLV